MILLIITLLIIVNNVYFIIIKCKVDNIIKIKQSLFNVPLLLPISVASGSLKEWWYKNITVKPTWNYR